MHVERTGTVADAKKRLQDQGIATDSASQIGLLLNGEWLTEDQILEELPLLPESFLLAVRKPAGTTHGNADQAPAIPYTKTMSRP